MATPAPLYIVEGDSLESRMIEKYEQLIRAQARSMWHPQMHAQHCDPEDVEQEVLMVLWERRDRIAHARHPIGFIVQAARYEAADALRRLCGNGQMQTLSIEGNPGLCNQFYSSYGEGDSFVE